MIDFSLAETAKIIDGKPVIQTSRLNQRISQIATDSRTIFKGENVLFFALKGPRNNGHNYIPELVKKKVRAFVVSEEESITGHADFILVKNTTAALQKLAAFHRQKYDYPVVGITGSNGKTIVKEWLFDVLTNEFSVIRNPKSFNSQVGVPLSVLLMNKNYSLGIFEAGISQPGEMAALAEIIRPEIGIFTNIGDAHQENFESKKQKISEKLLLFKYSKKLIFRVDYEELKKEAEHFCDQFSVEKISWTLNNKKAKIQFRAAEKTGTTDITATCENKTYTFSIPFTDDSAIENACHCFAAGLELAANPEKLIPAFNALTPVAMRLEIKQGINNCLLINDYYNSDFTSLTIALSVLHQQAKKGHLRKLVILSDIQQTGIPKYELYVRVNQLLSEWKIDALIGIGPEIFRRASDFSLPATFYSSLNEFENKYNRGIYRDSAILIKGARSFTFEKISGMLQQKAHQTVLEINMNAMVNNLNTFKGLLKPETKIMVMVKAFSYGSGDTEIANLLQFQNVDYLAVAVADEGVQLRNAGIQIPIIVMNPESHSFQHLVDYRLEPNIYSLQLLEDFLKTATENTLHHFPVHLKIDTGMNRLGLKTEHEIMKVTETINSSNQLKIKSVFSHLAASDDATFDSFTHEQIAKFESLFSKISGSVSGSIDRHILNSAGIERFPEKQYEMVRLGIGLYGISATGLPLENISTLKSTVSQVKMVQPDETVGYSRKGTVSEKSKIAVVPLGYADGLDRKLGNRNGSAMVNGKNVPIIGNICMDMLMLDVTNVNVKQGDLVEFFGPAISVSEVAEKAGTIPYEILTGISERVKRVYLYE